MGIKAFYRFVQTPEFALRESICTIIIYHIISIKYLLLQIPPIKQFLSVLVLVGPNKNRKKTDPKLLLIKKESKSINQTQSI